MAKATKMRSYRGAKVSWDRRWFEAAVDAVRLSGCVDSSVGSTTVRASVCGPSGERTTVSASAATPREACDAALAALVEWLRREAAERAALAGAIEGAP